MTSDFGGLRALLHDPGDLLGAWRELLELLEVELRHAPEATREQWLPYAIEHTRRWPAAVRMAPRWWVRAVLDRGQPIPLPGLATGLDAVRMPLEAFERAAASPSLDWVEHVTMGAPLVNRRAVAALSGATFLPRLTSLTVLDARRSLTPLARLRDAVTLERLRLERCKADAAFLGVWFVVGAPQLVHLDLSGSLPDIDAVRVLSRCDLPALRTLKLRSNAFQMPELEALRGARWLPDLTSLEVDLRWGFRDTQGLKRWLEHAPLAPQVRQTLAASWSLTAL